MNSRPKIFREIKRIGWQLLNIGGPVLGLLRRMHYDATSHSSMHVTDGFGEKHEDMAVILIYQPNHILKSLLFQLDFLNSKKIGILLVCNHELKAEYREELRGLCWKIIERPNIGYDFGGYRDGILFLLSEPQPPRNLFVLNDSIWFPLSRDCDVLERARDSDADVYGIFYNDKSKRNSHHHLQSYFYRFNHTVVSSKKFRALWENMPLINKKQDVILKLEKKTTSKLKKRGFTIDYTHSSKSIEEAITRLGDQELNEICEFYRSYTKYLNVNYNSIFKNIDSSEPSDLRKNILDSRFIYYFIDSHPLIFIRELSSPFIKKSRDLNYVIQRKEIIDGGYLDRVEPVIRREILQWDDDDTRIRRKAPA